MTTSPVRPSIRTIAAYLPAYAVPAVLGLVLVALLARTLGPAQFGIYSVCLSLHGLLLALAADPTSNSLRRLYGQDALIHEGERIIRAIFGLSLLLTGAVTVTGLILAALVTETFGLREWLKPIGATVVMTAAFALFQYLLTTLYVRERVGLTAGVQTLHGFVKTAAVLGGAAVAGTAAGSLLAYAAALALLSACLLGYLRGPAALRDTIRWRRALAYGAPLIGVSISFVLLAGFDRFALTSLMSEEAAGQYAATYLIAEGSVSLAAMVLHYSIYPPLVTHWERREIAAARELVLGTVDMFVVVAATVVAVLSVGGSDLTQLLAGDEYKVPDSVPLLVGTGLFFLRVAYFEAIGFELKLQSRALALTFGAAALVCIPITVAAVALDGVRGAALATALSYGLFWLFVRLREPLPEITSYPLLRSAKFIAATAVIALVAGRFGPWVGISVTAVLVPPVGALMLRTWPFARHEGRLAVPGSTRPPR